MNKQEKMAQFGYQLLPMNDSRRRLYYSAQVPFSKTKCHNFADETSGVLAENIVAFTFSEENGGVVAMIDSKDCYHFINRNNERIVEPKKATKTEADVVLSNNLYEAFMNLPTSAFKNTEFIKDMFEVLKEVIDGSAKIKISYSQKSEHEFECITNEEEMQEKLSNIENKIKTSMPNYEEVLSAATI